MQLNITKEKTEENEAEPPLSHNGIIICKATGNEEQDFLKLFMLSDRYYPVIYSSLIKLIIKYLFKRKFNLLSYENVYFAKINNKNIGMILLYNWKSNKIKSFITDLLILFKLKFKIFSKILLLFKFDSKIGKIKKWDFYISNISVIAEFRNKGIGKILMQKAFELAKEFNAKRVVLDVDKKNANAIKFYRNLDFVIKKEILINLKKNKQICFFRMVKNLDI